MSDARFAMRDVRHVGGAMRRSADRFGCRASWYRAPDFRASRHAHRTSDFRASRASHIAPRTSTDRD
jgi:hypothetical protein